MDRTLERSHMEYPEQGSPEATDLFEILVRENADMLRTFLRSALRDPGAIDDLFQETFLIAWKNLSRYDRNRPFAPWVRGIAARLVMADRRRQARMHILDTPELEHLERCYNDLSTAPGDTWNDKLDLLRRCLDRLRPPLRRVLDLRYHGDLGCKSIAEKMGDSTEAVKKRLQRARSYLALCLQSHPVEGDSHA